MLQKKGGAKTVKIVWHVCRRCWVGCVWKLRQVHRSHELRIHIAGFHLGPGRLLGIRVLAHHMGLQVRRLARPVHSTPLVTIDVMPYGLTRNHTVWWVASVYKYE